MEIKEEPASLMHDFKQADTPSKIPMKKLVGLFVIIVILGIGTGYLLAGTSNGGSAGGGTNLIGGGAQKGKIFGDKTTKGFDAEAPEGVIKSGGIDGEGAYHIDREGGASRTVYLTSSSVDLSQFVNKKVRVWGKSQQAQHAGWLLDVGRLEVL